MAPTSQRKKKQVTHDVVTREYTVNIHKRIYGMLVIYGIWIYYLFFEKVIHSITIEKYN